MASKKRTDLTQAQAEAALKKHGTQTKAAEAVGVHRTTFAKVLKGGVSKANYHQPKITPEEAQAAYFETGGNKTEAAERLGVTRQTFNKALSRAEMDDRPIHGGRVGYIQAQVQELPEPGVVARYILTSAQNNTRVNASFLENLEAYRDYLAQFGPARLMVSRFTYNKASYSSRKSVKPGRQPTTDDMRDLWYDKALHPYICDDMMDGGHPRYQLAPGLMWCAEMNILPTAARPLSALEQYTGRDSAIFPHAKLAMQSVASAPSEATKFMYTTGCVTQRNYIQKKAGLKAEYHHSYSALLVEVTDDGEWFVRQLEAKDDGVFFDIPSTVNQPGAVRVEKGKVTEGHAVEAINWGDVHAVEADPWVVEANWSRPDCIIDALRPRRQFMHDLLSFRSRSHHEMKDFARMFEKFLGGQDSVEQEVMETAELMKLADRDFCEMIVVSSNHDRHGERWLNEADYKKDLLNAEYFLEAQLERVRALKSNTPWTFAEWGLRKAGCPSSARFLGQDESYVICRRYEDGIECGMHGDDGPNGARGSTRSLTPMGRRVNKGHDHQAAIMDGVWSAGACAERFVYMHGPGAHSVSHIITYPIGTRSITTLWNGAWRA
jgi:predicted DNA-binding protein (UPF0251 family)